jgi:NADH:ubiquinone oxidoreductase subunit F (NADH-binding)
MIRPGAETGRPESESFYHLSGCDLAGKACQGTACFVARHLNPDRRAAAVARQPRVYCLGQCFAAPALCDDGVRPRVEVRSREGIVLARLAAGGARTLGHYTARGGGRALPLALSRPREEVINAIETSGLRGRGGAAFPAGRKWRAVGRQPADGKFIIANADEGDPGAYIDRFLMEEDPFCLMEGMTLAGYATGATKGWIYLRTEYPRAARNLRAAMAEARRAGLLGDRVLGRRDFGFDLDLFIGHGSYVCGEETALVRSLEGRRPEVMARPPYATEHGLWGRPTLIHNVETLAAVPWIVEHGGEAYRALGFANSRGTKAVSLNSLFARPGLYEVEFGVTVRHIVEELGGGLRTGPLRGVLIGGPLAGIIPPPLLDTPFGFEELRAIGASVGHGGVVAFDEHTSIAELVHHVFSFGAYESCGKCTPCRLGSRRVEHLFERLLRPPGDGRSIGATLDEVARLVSALKWTSLCGHGIGLGDFAESVLRHYGKELESCWR